MNMVRIMSVFSLALALNSVWAGSGLLNNYKTLTLLDGDWILSPADTQEGGATKKGQR